MIRTTTNQMLFQLLYQGGWDGQGMLHIWGRREMHTTLWWGNMKERDYSVKIQISWKNIEMDLTKNMDGRLWTA